MASGKTLTLFRSGALYLISDGTRGQLISDDGRTYEEADVQSIVAHCNTYDDWQELDAEDPLPAPVAALKARWLDRFEAGA